MSTPKWCSATAYPWNQRLEFCRVKATTFAGHNVILPSKFIPTCLHVLTYDRTGNTNCFTPSGGGPDPNECHVITDALLYDSQNIGALFTLDPAKNTSVITMQYRSCKTFMVNQDSGALNYCRTDWVCSLFYECRMFGAYKAFWGTSLLYLIGSPSIASLSRTRTVEIASPPTKGGSSSK